MADVPYKVVNGVNVELTADEISALDAARAAANADISQMRPARDGHLAATDKTQLADFPLGDHTAAEWATYRQELRDLMATPGMTNSNAVWPKSPIIAAAGQAAYDTEVAKEGSGPVAGEAARTEAEESAGYPGHGLA
jgi:hypothetical protein